MVYPEFSFWQAGLLPGVLNIVSGFGPIVGAALASHMDVDKLAFTGSTDTGKIVLELAARSNLKLMTLELGGKSAFIRSQRKRALRRVVGDPFKKGIEEGPQIDTEQFEKVLKYIRFGTESNATLECEGQRLGSKGFFIEPTVFSNDKVFFCFILYWHKWLAH
ncbi:hypothetical protein AHAS_Ahas11G0211600 [Arachis hypogaea]